MKKDILKFQCCFCGESINAINIDPCSIFFSINCDKSEEEQQSQQFFCHKICFEKHLHNSAKIYISDSLEIE
jgi:hypothetical protein